MTAAAIFDLDDTLYREMDYVEGGFRAVAGFLGKYYTVFYDEIVFEKTSMHSIPIDLNNFREEAIFKKMMDILNDFGRGKVFDKLIKFLGISNEEIVSYLIYLYRTHSPVIHTFEEVIPVLEHLRAAGMKTGLITDGMAIVQQNKVAALGIAGLFDVIIYTDAIGAEYWKPSPVPFKMALNILNVPAEDSVYVGDNQSKDFFAPNALGMKSVQIIREPGISRQTPEGQGYAAQTIISSLSEYFGVTP
ncbi:MAG: HAD hydrolase-like protein [Nitrospirae bacterium]|nr:HAD hydrolase-like protein [Nitrospirota bacterium]